MQNLLNSDDLLAEPRVKAAAEAMGIQLHLYEIIRKSCGCGKHNDLVMKSLADVAFEMRDAMVTEDLMWHWNLNINDLCSDVVEIDDRHMHSLRYATPKHWIIAAVLAFEVKQ